MDGATEHEHGNPGRAVEIAHAFLQFSDYQITRSGMRIEPGLKFEEWEKIGSSFGALNDFEHFGLGDWLNYGEEEYGERYTQAMDITGHAFETLQGYARVAKAIPFEERRKDLSFSFHKEVAALEGKERKRWLDQAEKNGWSLHEFRAALGDAERMKPSENGAPGAKRGRGRAKQPTEETKSITRRAAKQAEKQRGAAAKGRKAARAAEPEEGEEKLLEAVQEARKAGTAFDKAAAVVEREIEQQKTTMGARKSMITLMGNLQTALDSLGEAIQNL